MAARASIVGACETSVGKVREHNEDSHFIDVGRGIFAVCDGMGGHAAGEVASALAVNVIRERWSSAQVAQVLETWLDLGTPEARKQLIEVAQSGVTAAHDAIVAEAQRDKTKHGMGTTVVGALVVGGDVVFVQCGDSRAYLVRDGIAMQLTEDHTLLARLLAAGVDVDTSAEGARFKSMLTNALGIGPECKVATFVVPVASGDRFLLCSDGVTEYVQEVEIGEVLTSQPSPARAAQKLVELALARGGADNATALVVKVIEAGETARPVEQLQRDTRVISACPLWARSTPQGQLRALRIALPREYTAGERIPAQTLGDRVAWIVVEGEVELEHGGVLGAGGLLYPEALVESRPLPDKHGLGVVAVDVRLLALRADDFRELCADDTELGEQLHEALALIFDRGGHAAERGSTRAETTPADDLDEEGTVRHSVLGMAAQMAEPAAPPAGPRTRQIDPGTAATLPPIPRVVVPALGRPTTPPHSRRSEDGVTLPDGLSGPRGAPAVGAVRLPPPAGKELAPDDDYFARGPTDPHVVVARLAADHRAAHQEPPGPRAESSPVEPVAPPAPPGDADAQEATEITIEADVPPPPAARPALSTRHTRPTVPMDDSEPEISIERLAEPEAAAPIAAAVAAADADADDEEPEITMTLTEMPTEIVAINRAITANDGPHAAGTIDTEPKRRKRSD